MRLLDPRREVARVILASGIVVCARHAAAADTPGATVAQANTPSAATPAGQVPTAALPANAAAAPPANNSAAPPANTAAAPPANTAAAPPATPPGAAAPAAEAADQPPPETPEADPNPVTQDDVQGVRSDLENFKFQWQRERDLHTAITTRSLLIGGVVQTRVGWTDQPVDAATVKDRTVTFDIGAALLSFSGNLYKDYEEGRNLSYQLRFGASPQQATNNSFLNLLDAQLTYSPLPTINPEYPVLQITLGQQLLPFGVEVPATEELKPVITNAQFTTKLSLARRDIGLIVRGDLFPQVDYGYDYRAPIITYALGVINGSGPNTPDENSEKDIVARLAFTVPSDYNSWLRQITVGGSVYYGWQNTFLKDEKKTLSGKGRKRRYGADFYYNHFPFGVTYEFIYGEDDATLGATPEAPGKTTLKSLSHVATLFYNFGEQFLKSSRNQGKYDDYWPKTYQPFLRLDTFDPDTGTKNNRVDAYTLGLNVFFAETTKFQLNLNRRDDRTNKRGVQNEILGQFQFGF